MTWAVEFRVERVMFESRLTRTSAPPCVPGKVDEKATQLHAIASLKVLLDATKPHNGAATTSAANHVTVAQRLESEKQETQLAGLQEQPNGVASGLEDAAAVDTVSTKKNPYIPLCFLLQCIYFARARSLQLRVCGNLAAQVLTLGPQYKNIQ